MRYIRSRPWRSRAPWFNTRAGARRRGYRGDELSHLSAPAAAIGDDVVIESPDANEMTAADDVLISGPADVAAAEPILAARIDISGMLAMADAESTPESRRSA